MSLLTQVLDTPAKRKEAKRFVKFGIVGAFGAVVDFSVLNALIFLAGWSSTQGKLFANIISTSVAIVSNFTWNRLWTFPESRSRKKRYQLVQFTIVNLIGLAINTGIFYVADHYIYEPFVSTNLAIQLAKATAIGIVLFWNFGANRLWTYRGL
ncbi:MAG: GtrA family protein [Caldilineae bacterium]|nr:MAG: GtrA family protein [Caldilineae bacterium]